MKNANIVPPCPICSSQNIGFVSKHNNFPDTGIWFCSLCNYWFGYPEPDGLELERYYDETYSPFRRRYFGEEYYVLMERRAQAQIRFISDCLSRSSISSSLRGWKIIDWGCGVGALVAALQHRGAEAVGYDSDFEAIDVGQKRWGANISVNSSYDLSLFQGQFDLLLLSHVVEHLSDIRQTLRGLLKVLRPGGFVFIEVPNCFGEMFLPEMDTESHLHFFSKQSLILLLEGLGVQVLTCVSCGPQKQPLFHQTQIPETTKLATRMVRRIKLIPKLVVSLLGDNAKQTRTIYDGYYDKYYERANLGIWIRCLAQLKG